MRTLVTAVLVVLVLGACSGGGNDEATEDAPTTTQQATIDGVPADGYNEAVAEWDAVVAEWDALTAERDAAGTDAVVVDGQRYETYAEWAAATGRPVRFEDVLEKYRR